MLNGHCYFNTPHVLFVQADHRMKPSHAYGTGPTQETITGHKPQTVGGGQAQGCKPHTPRLASLTVKNTTTSFDRVSYLIPIMYSYLASFSEIFCGYRYFSSVHHSMMYADTTDKCRYVLMQMHIIFVFVSCFTNTLLNHNRKLYTHAIRVQNR